MLNWKRFSHITLLALLASCSEAVSPFDDGSVRPDAVQPMDATPYPDAVPPSDGSIPPYDGDIPPYDGGPGPDGGTVCIAPDGRTVRPGERISDGCNDCYCTLDGTFMCTDRTCPDVIQPDVAPDAWVDSGYDVTPPYDAGYDARPDSQPPYDAGVCIAPNGVVLRPGQSTYDGCNACYCGPNAQLSCTNRVCQDAGYDVTPPYDSGYDVTPPYDASYDGGPYDGGPWNDASVDVAPWDGGVTCVGPSGERLAPGQTVQYGCLSCVCTSSGSLSCSNTCPADGGTPDAGRCHDLVVAANAPYPTVSAVRGTRPIALGGRIEDGVYEIRSYTMYNAPTPPPGSIGRVWLRIRAGRMEVAQDSTSGPNDPMTYQYMPSGNRLWLSLTCPYNSSAEAIEYTAGVGRFTWYSTGPDTAIEFVRRAP